VHGDLGGSAAVDSGISTPGLDIWVVGKPYEGAANGGASKDAQSQLNATTFIPETDVTLDP
jgi:hypothetical protein